MFKKMYDSLSVGVHLEFLVQDDNICLKVWEPISKDQFDGDIVSGTYAEASLTLPAFPDYGEFPADNTGVFHSKLPAMTMVGTKTTGETLLANMPAAIKDSYTAKLADTYWHNTSHSWVDPTDPSISDVEKDDVGCWVIGINKSREATACFNALASSHNSKAHPLRSARQYGAPASLFVYRTFKSDKFTECSLTLKYNKGYGFSTNILDGWSIGTDDKELFKTSGDGYNYIGQMKEAFPHFETTSGGGDIDAGDTDTVNFKMVDSDDTLIEKNSEAYLESTGGYLPKTRVPIVDGLGSFKVTALGLDTDDEFKVKIGFRNLTGVHDVNYKVA